MRGLYILESSGRVLELQIVMAVILYITFTHRQQNILTQFSLFRQNADWSETSGVLCGPCAPYSHRSHYRQYHVSTAIREITFYDQSGKRVRKRERGVARRVVEKGRRI